jgi:hypothetical protein
MRITGDDTGAGEPSILEMADELLPGPASFLKRRVKAQNLPLAVLCDAYCDQNRRRAGRTLAVHLGGAPGCASRRRARTGRPLELTR